MSHDREKPADYNGTMLKSSPHPSPLHGEGLDGSTQLAKETHAGHDAPPASSGITPATLWYPSLGSGFDLGPGFPFCASRSVYLTWTPTTLRSLWGLPSSTTYLFLHATA